MLKRTSSKKIDEAVSKSVNFEIAVSDLARKSERRAWMVAFVALVMSLILAGGYFYMLPLKEKVPYVVMADAYTGTASMARLTDDFVNRKISTSEAINRSNVAHFVLAREAYDVALFSRDWPTVWVMSSPQVAAAYRQLHSGANPNSPYKTYGKERAIRVKILSIVLTGGGPNQPPTGATVRFQRSIYEKQTGLTRPLDSKLATIEFTYKPNLKMDDQDRIENPLGFQVTSYRVDNDYATAPPEEQEAPTETPAAPQPGFGEAPEGVPAPGAQPAAEAQPATAVAPRPEMIPEREEPRTTAPAAPAPRNTANGVGRR
jgi:type IV secretion system protein VirB8